MVKESNLLSEKEWEVVEGPIRELWVYNHTGLIIRNAYIQLNKGYRDIVSAGFKNKESGMMVILDGNTVLENGDEIYCDFISEENFNMMTEMNVIDDDAWDVIVCRRPKA